MTMITCLILWIPRGTTYVPDGPPATSPDGVALGLAGTLTPGAVHAVSTAAMSRPASALRDDGRLRRLVPIHEPFPMPHSGRPAPATRIGSSVVPLVGSYPKAERATPALRAPGPQQAAG